MPLGRYLGISYSAVWRMKHKLIQIMLERDDSYKLSGIIVPVASKNHALLVQGFSKKFNMIRIATHCFNVVQLLVNSR